METFNFKKSELPALKIEKQDSREAIENDHAVKSLVASKLLLDKGLNQLMIEFSSCTQEINSLLAIKDDPRKLHLELAGTKGYRDFIMSEFGLIRRLKSGTVKQKKELEEELRKRNFENHKKINQKLKNKLKSLSNKLLSDLDAFEKRYRPKPKLNILGNINLYICKNCKRILCLDRFHSEKCECGQEIGSVAKCEVLPIYRLGEKISSFFLNNMWLEHGIDYLLRRKNYETLCGYYVLGHSGIRHEVDNIGYFTKQDLRMLCECKNKDITVQDVFVFWGKMSDTGFAKGYIFTTADETFIEVKRLARSKNISIIESVLERDNKEIVEEITVENL